MTIQYDAELGLCFSQVQSDYFQLLQQIPVHGDSSGFSSGEHRLRPSPIADPANDEDEEINADWREHVLPDMIEEFARQLDVVSEDLKTAKRFQDRGGEEEYAFVIPKDHIDRWYGALNQARLVMQERYRFPEEDTSEAIEALMNTDRFGPYLISRFYTEIQGVLLRVMTDEG
jgi:hypothetical protein